MKNRNVAAWIVLIIGLASCLIQAQIYSWEDQNGVKHFSDDPPQIRKGVKDLKSMNVHSEADSTGGFAQNASEKQTARDVVIYTTSWCGYCKRAKAWLNANEIRYEEYDIEESSANNRKYKDAGGDGGVPLIVVGDHKMAGWDESGMRKMLGMN